MLFRQAHEINPNARTQRALGAVSYEVRQYVDSVRWLEGALIDQRRALTDVQRSEVQGLLERAYRFVGRFEVEVEDGATIRVDGETSEAPLVLPIGEHSIRASIGAREVTEEIRVRGGENETLRLALPREGELVRPVTEPVDESPSHVLSSIGFTVAGIGVGLFAIGGGLGTAKRNELSDCRALGCPDDDVDQLETHARIANAGVGIAAIGLTAGLIFRFALEREPEVSASASRDGASVTWRRRF